MCIFVILLVCGAVLCRGLPQTLQDLLAQADSLEKRQDYAGAEKVYKQALQDFPHQPEILKRLGVLYQNELQFPKSVEALEKAAIG